MRHDSHHRWPPYTSRDPRGLTALLPGLLTGGVRENEQRTVAADVVGRIPGVVRVRNEIVVMRLGRTTLGLWVIGAGHEAGARQGSRRRGEEDRAGSLLARQGAVRAGVWGKLVQATQE